VVAISLHVLAPEGRGFIKHAGQETLYHSSPALRLGDPTRTVVGDGIFVVSNPRGYEGTLSQGIMSAIRREGELDVVQISAPLSHASSGGPVLNAAGQVIGVASALVDGEQSINFALPASLVAQLLARVNPTALAESLPAALDRASAVLAEPGRSTPPDLTYEP
jgi:Trypsin-like peptidase domain